ncbi:hypothetical protein TREES_T100003350 [Tupaia chinensis]|uniref:Uncharacterized protein n=1 Tax=Tupaia chinensis TaxID=246437 RepID=L9JB09_TUPCH|nr:hypothetical protein TREES_T100003350 [Tupaia chinensis]
MKSPDAIENDPTAQPAAYMSSSVTQHVSLREIGVEKQTSYKMLSWHLLKGRFLTLGLNEGSLPVLWKKTQDVPLLGCFTTF